MGDDIIKNKIVDLVTEFFLTNQKALNSTDLNVFYERVKG